MLPHLITIAADVHDVAVVEEPVDYGGANGFIADDVAPLLKALAAGQCRRGVLAASAHELEEELRAGPRDRGIADLVDHHETWEGERPEAPREVSGLLRLFERRDDISKRSVSPEQPISTATDRISVHCDPWSSACSWTS